MATTTDNWKESPGRIAPLESGDRLTRQEFERRYATLPELKKAELIEGVVYVSSPARHAQHGGPQADVIGWLVNYRANTPGVEVDDNATVRLDLDNEPQPDALLRIAPERGGQSRTSEDDYVEGPPELIVEVASSSASYDLHDKLNAYRRNGVREYVVWRVLEEAVDWFVLREGRYERLQPDAAGLLRSETFPGLWLDVAALLRRDIATVLAILQQGVDSREHATFLNRLRSTGTSSS